MKPLFKKIALAVLLVGVVSFVKLDRKAKNSMLNLQDIEVMDILSTHRADFRPDGDYAFYVETDLVQKIRGANKVNAKIFILERATGKKSLLASQNIQIKNYADAIAIDVKPLIEDFEVFELPNGDQVIGCSKLTPFTFNELMQFDTIYNSYIKSSQELLKTHRKL